MKTFKFEYVGEEPISANPGEGVSIWGHIFVWDGKRAVCELKEEARAAIQSEIDNGRPYKMLKAGGPKPKPAPPTAPPAEDK